MERRWAQSTDRTWCEGRVGLATACRRLPGGSSAASFNQTRGEAWSVRGRTQFRAVGVTARTKKCLKGITCVRFTPKMRVYALNCVTPAQRNFLPRRLHASPSLPCLAIPFIVGVSNQTPQCGCPKGGCPQPTNRAAANRPVGARPCLARTPEAHKRWVSPSTQKVGVPIQPRAARLHYPAHTHIEQIAHANSLKRLTSWIQVRAFRHGYLRAGAINCRHKSNECSRQRQQAR